MLREQILGATGRKVHRFAVPQWGFDVCIRSWSVRDVEALQTMAEQGTSDILGRIVVMSLSDEQGNLLFTDEHIPTLLEKDLDALRLICDEARALNGLTAEHLDEQKKS